MKIDNNLVYFIDIIEKPIIKETNLFLWSIILMILPTMINALWINGSEMSFLYIIQTNRFGASIPYIFFVPFILSYVISIIQLILRRNYAKWIIYSVLLFLMSLNIFLLLNFSTMVSPMMFTLLMETTRAETSGFISTYLFSKGTLITFTILFFLTILIIISEKIRFREIVERLSSSFVAKLSILVIMAYFMYRGIVSLIYFLTLFSCRTPLDVEEWSHGYKYETNTITVSIYSIYDYFGQKQDINHFYEIMSHLNSDEISSGTDTLDVVLVIGESYNKYHSELYGYKFETTPLMEKERIKGRLFVFDDVVTPYNMTSFVIKNLFSVNSIYDRESWTDFPFFQAIFKKAGYDVYFWDNQMIKSGGDVSDFSLNALIHNNDISCLSYTNTNDVTYKYDGELVDNFRDNIQLDSDKNLVIFHLQGQHFDSKDRYPHNIGYDLFSYSSYNKPDLSKGMRQYIADYDNATLYNDYVNNKIVELFIERNAIIVFLSDHGEEVYDYREFQGRTHEIDKSRDALKYQYEIPFFVWLSNQFMKKNPQVVDRIKNSSHKRYMIDNVSQFLMGLAKIKTIYYKPDRDVLSESFCEKKRIIQNSIDYDKQMGNH